MRMRLHRGALTSVFALAACSGASEPATVRFATYNTSLNRPAAGALIAELNAGSDPARHIAEVIQRVRPDVLLLNEFDYDADGRALELFRERYLGVSQNVSGSEEAAEPIAYEFAFVAPVNNGVPSGFDLNNDGQIGTEGRPYGDDSFAFGLFEGQYGMVVLSRYPIDEASVRTFQRFLWRDLPGAMLPIDPATGESWYSDEELAVLRLPSKSHWDVPVDVAGTVIHVLASHPTPPVFDGPEDRNGTRNHDEIRFWAEYIGPATDFVYDDAGRRGGLARGERFVIMGDQNADPNDGDSTGDPIDLLLFHELVNNAVAPVSEGGPEQARLQGGVSAEHTGDPRFDTADFVEPPGNLRADYVLPSRSLTIIDARVFWPLQSDPLFPLVGVHPFPATEHKLVYVDIAL